MKSLINLSTQTSWMLALFVCRLPALAAGHAEGVPVGIGSLDVAAEAGRLHVLTAAYSGAGQPPELLYQASVDGGASWSKAVRVDAGAVPPANPHRGMDAQIVGTGKNVMAVWMTKGTGLFDSGPMATALSEDGGRKWWPGPNPADDGSTTGHGFIDVAADARGVFHLVWLDSRDGAQGLRYASSSDGGRTWSRNVTIKPQTCECCSNTLAVGGDGNVFALFRDKTPRDMAITRSKDLGRSWSKPTSVGKFGWDFNGCPHVGGGLALEPKGKRLVLHGLAWTGQSGRSGLHYLSSDDDGKSWSKPRPLGSRDAKRGDIAAGVNGQVAAVWEVNGEGETWVEGAYSRNGGRTWSEPQRLSSPGAAAVYPRVAATGMEFQVFWTETRTGQASVWKNVSFGE